MALYLYQKATLTGKLQCLTGLHIGFSKDDAEIGGTDSPIIKKMGNNSPYIPASSLKGKLRYLLERIQGDNLKSDFNWSSYSDTLIPELFGVGADNETVPLKQSKIVFYDAFPDKNIIELKHENMVNRLTMASDMGLRVIERVPAGISFSLQIDINIYIDDSEKNPQEAAQKKLDQYINLLKKGFALLQDDYLGANGSRGYGQIELLDDFNIEIRPAYTPATSSNTPEKQIQLFKLKFTSPLHLANDKEDYAQTLTRLHSDTIYAAVMQAWKELGRTDLINKVNENNGEMGFTISSFFPYVIDSKGGTHFFLPKPFKQVELKQSGSQKDTLAKKLKKVKWVDSATFKKIIENPLGDEIEFKDIDGDFLTARPQRILPKIHTQVIPKIKTKNFTVGDPFYLEQLSFDENSGLYCLFEGDEQPFLLAMNYLQEAGIGSDRSSGNGKFIISKVSEKETKDINSLFDDKKNATHICNLSLFLPEAPQTIEKLISKNDPHIGYSLLKRGGWITDSPNSNNKKNAIHFFQEGSIFVKNQSEYRIQGTAKNLCPKFLQENSNKIWRCGKSFFVPVSFD